MSFLGMGTLEILIVLLIAFIFLGPERMVDVARKLGKLTAEMRRMAADLPRIDLDEDILNRPESPIVHRGGGPDPQTTEEQTRDSRDKTENEAADEGDGPVAHQRVTRAKISPDTGDATSQREQRSDE